MESYDILVILLSVSLGISLLVWIIVGVLLIQVFKKVKEATDTAKAAAEHVEEFTAQLRNAGKATAAGTALAQIMKVFKGRK